MRLQLFSLLIIFSTNVFALVDYTDPSEMAQDSPSPQKNSVPVPNRSTKAVNTAHSSEGKSSGYQFVFATGIESLKVQTRTQEGGLNFYKLNTHLQTPYDLFFDASYWYASSSDYFLTTRSGTQPGNLMARLGFNWMKWGDASNLVGINFYGGGMMRGHKSDFASTRSDELVGLETTKRFGTVGLGLAYEMRFTGKPADKSETIIGNIQRFTAGLAWVVSSDISFQLEAGNVRIAEGGGGQKAPILDQAVSYNYLSPKLDLGISGSINLDMGATFRTKGPGARQTELLAARVWDVPAAVGNSLFAGLSLAF